MNGNNNVNRYINALRNLSKYERIAYCLFIIARMTYQEIADNQGWSINTVRKGIHDARRKLIQEDFGDMEL